MELVKGRVSVVEQRYFCLITGWSMRRFPNTVRWFDHLRHSSTTRRDIETEAQHMTQRSWLKLDMMTGKP